MPSFTVLAAERIGEPKDKGYGPKQDIALKLRATDGREHDCKWWTNAATPLPAQGSSIDGDLEASDFGVKFKKARGAFGGGGGKSPEQQNAIQRQHSQEMALRYAAVQAARGVLPEAFTLGEEFRRIIDWFEADISPSTRSGKPGMVGGLPVRNEPQRTGAPEPTTPTADYAQPPGEHPDAGDVPWEQSA